MAEFYFCLFAFAGVLFEAEINHLSMLNTFAFLYRSEQYTYTKKNEQRDTDKKANIILF